MSPEQTAIQDPFADLSLKKQEVYRRYAQGELSWLDAAKGIEGIQPPPPKQSRKQKIAIFLSTFLLSMLIPPWAKRED